MVAIVVTGLDGDRRDHRERTAVASRHRDTVPVI
jgi:hypothetical protein